mgnify:FL=1
MSYRLQLTQFEENPDYADELADYKKRQGYGYSPEGKYPKREIEKRHLDAIVTDEEYKAIKKAVLEIV